MGTQKARYWKTKLDSLVGSDIKNTSATYSVSICFELMPVQLVHELIIHRHRLYYKAKICFLCYLEYLHSFKFAGLQTVKKKNPLSIIFTTWAVRLVIKLNKSKIGVQSLYWSICFNTLYACLKAACLYGGLLAYWHFKTVFPLINNRHRLWAPDQENKTVMGFILDLLMVEGKTGGKAKEGVKWLSYTLRWLGKRRQDMWQDEGE